jgi:hypothetical protein
MTATQSHALRFEEFPVRRTAWPARNRGNGPVVASAFFASVVVDIVEIAVDTARRQLTMGQTPLGAYEQSEWGQAETEAWLVQQA